ncbi:MAG: shikimate dehydrogenase [Anaerolineales bacterium]
MNRYALGLIGYPVNHSLSPKLHHAALEAAGLEGEYRLYPIVPGEGGELRELLGKVRAGEVQGLNVTIPHKQTVIQYLDELTPTAQAIGAVNTIYFRDDKLIGGNTDAPGFLADLKRFLGRRPETENWHTPSPLPHPQSALVLGAGGSARAVVYALLQDGWRITLAARRIEQAEALINNISRIMHHASTLQHFNASVTLPMTQLPNDLITPSPITNLQSPITQLPNSPISLLINTTPLGMTPHPDSSPWPPTLPFPKHAAVYDLVYNPRETKLVRDARAAALPATTGLGMLIEQAALAFEIWTGKRADREVMREAVT